MCALTWSGTERNQVIGSEGSSPDILGIEMTPTVVRAVRLNRDARTVLGAAECPVMAVGDAVTLDPSAIGPALDEVLYQLEIDDRTEHLAGVSIGPTRAGVGSGPALPAWLEHRARQLGENMVCAGKLGISFCPQRALDTAIMVCEQANITVSRIDFAPVAAARTLQPGTDTMTVGSGRGWRARLRDDEVLEALENAEIATDDPLRVITPDGVGVSIDEFYGVALESGVAIGTDDDIGHLAAAVGCAIGVVDGSSGNLLDGDTVRGRSVVSGFGESAGVFGAGSDAFGSRTTVDLVRSQGEPASRSVIRRVGTVDPPGSGSGSDLLVDADDPLDDSTLSLRDAGSTVGSGSGLDAMGVGDPEGGAGQAVSDAGRQTGLEIHPDDPIQNFSPEPGAEHSLEGRGRNMALIVAALVLFSVAVAIGILVTQG